MCEKWSWSFRWRDYLSDLVGSRFAFFGLAAVSAGGPALAFAALPQTKQQTAVARRR
jgi:hypothetical protein